MGAAVGIIGLLIYLGIIFLVFSGYWKTFAKAGQPGWAILIPIYNGLVMADIAKVSRAQVWKAIGVIFIGYIAYIGLLFGANNGGEADFGMMGIGMLVLFAAIILAMVFMWPVYKGIALNFGQSVGFAIGLMLLSAIFFAILGWGNAQYIGHQRIGDDILDSDL